MPDRIQISLRVPVRLLAELEREADRRDVSRSEHIRDVLQERERVDELERQVDRLQERVAARENRIDELEEQLARRSQVEEKIDTLATRVQDDDQPDPPWPIRWYRYFRD